MWSVLLMIIFRGTFLLDGVQPYSVADNNEIENYYLEVESWIKQIEQQYLHFNRISALLTWRQTVNPSPEIMELVAKLTTAKTQWHSQVCERVSEVHEEYLELDQERKLYLLCRGPNYTDSEMVIMTDLQDKMYEAFVTSKLCLSEKENCLSAEPDLDRLMGLRNTTPEMMLWIWEGWHNMVGPKVKEIYPDFVRVMNKGAHRNFYEDIGEVWREELEIDDLENIVDALYEGIKPLYVDLHAVIRYRLHQKYGSSLIDPYGPIPAHLLGNMWAQDWSALIDLLIKPMVNFEEIMKQRNWTVGDMILKAEDFYTSMHLPPMTEKFWNNSRFEKTNGNTSCHGTAADMYAPDDFRILMCADLTMNDFYIIHHEMGHIQYYMAYSDQSPLFQEGTSSAFQEAIGDAIMLGVMSPIHLNRLGLLNDQQLKDRDVNLFILLSQALSKIPQLPYALLIDKYRWDIFNGNIKPTNYNQVFWQLNEQLRGIKPPSERSEKYFDAAGKFHVPDNTPYIRYFLSYIIQVQIFKGMCELNVYGKLVTSTAKLDHVPMPFPLHRCDIYGSKTAGKKLKQMLEIGASQPWNEVLPILTGKNRLSSKEFLEYFEPIHKWLKAQILKYDIPQGW